MRYIQIYMRFYAVSHVVQTKYKARVNWKIQRGIFFGSMGATQAAEWEREMMSQL